MSQATKAQHRLTRLRARLLGRFPEGYARLPARWQAVDHLPRLTVGLLPDEVWFNPEWVVEADEEQLFYLLAHLAMHQLLGHRPWQAFSHGRRRVAEDMAVAAALAHLGWMASTQWGLSCPPRLQGLSATQLAAALTPEEVAGYPQLDTHALQRFPKVPASEEGDLLGGQDIEPDESEEAAQEGEQDMDTQSVEAASKQLRQDDRSRSFAPPGLLLPRRAATQPWWSLLAHQLKYRVQRDYRFDRPSRRQFEPFVLPALGGQEARLAVAVDISGSIPPELVRQFLDEVELLRRMVPATVRLILVDNRIHLDRLVPMGEALRLPPFQGGGGTDFRPVFSLLETDLSLDFLIYFTDLRGEFPNRAPRLEVIWLRAGSLIEAPFGKVLDWQSVS